MLDIGSKAPEFSSIDQFGETVQLSNHRGKWVLLYFYPKDDTPGCTKEACGLRDAWGELSRLAVVLGVSADDVSSHKEFSDKYNLPFQLLADTGKSILNDYQAWGKKDILGQQYEGILRVTYIIDPQGNIAKAYPEVKPDEHTGQVISDLQALVSSHE